MLYWQKVHLIFSIAFDLPKMCARFCVCEDDMFDSSKVQYSLPFCPFWYIMHNDHYCYYYCWHQQHIINSIWNHVKQPNTQYCGSSSITDDCHYAQSPIRIDTLSLLYSWLAFYSPFLCFPFPPNSQWWGWEHKQVAKCFLLISFMESLHNQERDASFWKLLYSLSLSLYCPTIVIVIVHSCSIITKEIRV